MDAKVRMVVAKELVAVARELALLGADDDGDEGEDPQFAQKVRDLKTVMNKLTSRKNKRLKQYGIAEMIRPNDTVEKLVDALRRCAV
jgi:uncharacterized protein with PIN domain